MSRNCNAAPRGALRLEDSRMPKKFALLPSDDTDHFALDNDPLLDFSTIIDAAENAPQAAVTPYPNHPVNDFNGDRLSDLLWQDAEGNVAEWLISGGQVIGGGAVANA